MTTETAQPRINSDTVESSDKVVRHQIVIVGGGTAGITVAAQLTKGLFNKSDVMIIDPSDSHYYQPAWTLVGGGAYRKEDTRRPEASVIPPKAKWIQDAVTEFDPEHNRLRTRDGLTIEYDYLIVGAGIQINWNSIDGLVDTIGKNGVCSNYSFETVGYTWDCVRDFQGGTAVFTQPATAVKCGGAPQKICHLAEDYFRKHGIRDKSRVIFAAAGASIFAVEKYSRVLEQVVERKGTDTLFHHNLIAVNGPMKEATFRNTETGEDEVIKYDMIHVTPPMGPPDFIAKSSLADSGGWVDVDKHTLQHVRYRNVFSLGDSSNLPTSKTGAAVRKQAPVLVRNLRSLMAGQPLSARYTGYTSCPVVTGYGTMVLAEFDYDRNPMETFPLNQARERWSMWLFKKYFLPLMYWNGMLKGRA